MCLGKVSREEPGVRDGTGACMSGRYVNTQPALRVGELRVGEVKRGR